MVNEAKETDVSEKKSPKQKRTVQSKKQSEKATTSGERQKLGRKTASNSAVAANSSVIKSLTKGKGKNAKTTARKKPAKKSLDKKVYKERDTLSIGRANTSELKKVESVIEKLSKKPTPSVRVTVPGVLRKASSKPKTVPCDQKVAPVVEIRNYLKKFFGSNA